MRSCTTWPRDAQWCFARGASVALRPKPVESSSDMTSAKRTRNPFTSSARGGQLLSAVQLPFFLARPPAAYGVLTATGRKTGKRRRRCIRAVRSGETVYLVAIKGSAKTGWVRNALANPGLKLRLPGGSYSGRARLIASPERSQARQAYAETVAPFDYLTYGNWRKGWPTAPLIRDLMASWFDEGFPIAIELVQ
jgi:deazaflavin-dependent oxidoreductase (nitroreductase family)